MHLDQDTFEEITKWFRDKEEKAIAILRKPGMSEEETRHCRGELRLIDKFFKDFGTKNPPKIKVHFYS